MKSDVMQSIVQIEANELKNLVSEVKETIADGVELNQKNNPSFGKTDLWNIRRKSKPAKSMMRNRNI